MCCRSQCAYLAVIVGIIAGVILGVLFSLGLVPTGVVFPAYVAIGLAGVFLSPIYALLDRLCGEKRCFCTNRVLLLVVAIGTIVSAAIGFIVAGIASTTVLAIILGVATFFAVTLIGIVICITRCICRD